jgi:hypothetical protein
MAKEKGGREAKKPKRNLTGLRRRRKTRTDITDYQVSNKGEVSPSR